MADYSDGNILLGGFTITFDTAGLTAIVDSCTDNKPMKVVNRTDENDDPAAAFAYDDFHTCTMTIQINQTAEQADLRGDSFTTSSIDNTSRTYFVTSQSAAKNKGQMVTYDLTCQRAYN
jgi:hypothetical protein